MKEQNSSEKEFIEQLKNMPDFKDNQSKEELFLKIEQKIKSREKQPSKKWIKPAAFSTVAAAIFFTFFTWNALNSQENVALEDEQHTTIQFDQDAESIHNGTSLNKGMEQSSSSITSIIPQKPLLMRSTIDPMPYQGAVLHHDIRHHLITLVVPDQQAQHTIPVSFIVQSDEVNFSAQMLQDAIKHFNENANHFGLSNFFISDASYSISENGNVLNINVQKNHNLDNGTASVQMFYKTIKGLLTYLPFEKITFTTEGSSGVQLDHVGIVYELSLKDFTNNPSGYYVYESSTSIHQYLIPISFSGKLTFKEMLNRLSEAQLNVYKSTIPSENMFKNIKINGSSATIQFNKDIILKNDMKHIQLIDAILLTAKQYGITDVQFLGANISEKFTVGNYAMSQKIAVPILPNGILLNK